MFGYKALVIKEQKEDIKRLLDLNETLMKRNEELLAFTKQVMAKRRNPDNPIGDKRIGFK